MRIFVKFITWCIRLKSVNKVLRALAPYLQDRRPRPLFFYMFGAMFSLPFS